jgi:hypothetical protein
MCQYDSLQSMCDTCIENEVMYWYMSAEHDRLIEEELH